MTLIDLTHPPDRPADDAPGALVPARDAAGRPLTQTQTPVLRLNIGRIRQRWHEIAAAFAGFDIYYAVKANPHPQVLAALAVLGARFDAASIGEIEAVLATGTPPDRISFGNTIKKHRDISIAHALGVRLFAVDAPDDLAKIAGAAPGAMVFCRLDVDGSGAEWPLSRKFGCDPDRAVALMLQARASGLDPVGISFHVGSQQVRPHAFDAALERVAGVAARLLNAGLRLRLVNIGGGLPARYTTDIPSLAHYSAAVDRAIDRHLLPVLGRRPRLAAELGRGLVAEAGQIETEVVLVADRGTGADTRRWVYIDIGVFHGLAETLGEAIRYPISRVSADDGAPDEPTGPVVLAGPTCDSADILYERRPVDLPLGLRSGDRLVIGATGAYTHSYSSVGFNGLPPLRVECHDDVPAAMCPPVRRSVAG
ncbi:type III PLP-dependent enzyme [Tistrella sp. BH-R2-4]|uniref:ornithine decarboxylase n=1 Tax=Tistrella arctica TaxID=3133430 RepID=A0ABU9YR47_9PROT